MKKNQPYFLKRQIIGLIVAFGIIMCKGIILNEIEYGAIEAVFFVILGMTFLPTLLKKIKNRFIAVSIYYIPLYMVIYFRNNYEAKNNQFLAVLAIICILVLIIICKERYRYTLNGILAKVPLNIKKFAIETYILIIAIFSEEIFFRYYLISKLIIEVEYNSILISAFLFVAMHYLNRWADKIFDKRSYASLTILGILLGTVYVAYASIWVCICIHLLYNSAELIRDVKRLFVKKQNTTFFDDYD